MPSPTSPAPRGTRALTSAILEALGKIPEEHRKSALKHATAAVRDRLIAQAEKAKAAARRAPAIPGAKRAAAVAATRKAAAADAAARATASRRGGRRRSGAATAEPDVSATPELDEEVRASVR